MTDSVTFTDRPWGFLGGWHGADAEESYGPGPVFLRLPAALRLVIAAMGRSGTGYMAQLLTAAGAPCTHEKVFAAGNQVDLGASERDSSGFAVPWLGKLHPTTAVVHVVRHPLDWMTSWQRKRYAGPYLRSYLSFDYTRLYTESPERAVMQAWVEWNLNIEKYADLRVRVEEISAQQLQQISELGGATVTPDSCALALADTPHNVNTMDGENCTKVTVADLPSCKESDRFLALASRYGYRGEELRM